MKFLPLIYFFLHFSSFCQELKPEVGLRTNKVLYPTIVQSIDKGKETDHLVMNGQEKVSIKMVKYYCTGSDYFLVRKPAEIALKDKYSELGYDLNNYIHMKRTEIGDISLFEFSKNQYTPVYSGSAGISKQNFTYFRYDSNLKLLNKDNLRSSLNHDDLSLQRIKSYTRYRLVHTGLVFCGLMASSIGISKMFVRDETNSFNRFNFRPNPFFVGGLSIIVLSISIGRKNKIDLIDIVRDYNLRHPH